MITEKDYNVISEAIVFDLLEKKYGKGKVKKVPRGPGNIGDVKVVKKTIEVKGLYVDESGSDDDKFDFVSSGFNFSDKEWKIICEDSDNFELWVVYRLDRKNYKDWDVKYAVMDGHTLLKCKPSWRKVTLAMPKKMWEDTIQEKVPLSIWEKHKNKKRKN